MKTSSGRGGVGGGILCPNCSVIERFLGVLCVGSGWVQLWLALIAG